MDHYPRNRVCPSEPHVFPRLPRVGGLEHAGASMGTPEDICLTGPYPHDTGVGWVECDVTDRRRWALFEHREPGRPFVDGFPNTARGTGGVNCVRPTPWDSDVGHSPADVGRTEELPWQVLEQRLPLHGNVAFVPL